MPGSRWHAGHRHRYAETGPVPSPSGRATYLDVLADAVAAADAHVDPADAHNRVQWLYVAVGHVVDRLGMPATLAGRGGPAGGDPHAG